MTTDRSLRVMLGASTLAIVSGTLGALAYLHMPLSPDGDPVLGSPQVIMFETEWCDWCEKFRRRVGKDYQGSPLATKAPLRYMSIDDGPPPKKYRLSSFSGQPVLVMFDQYGRELERIEKPPADVAPVESMVRRNLRRVSKI